MAITERSPSRSIRFPFSVQSPRTNIRRSKINNNNNNNNNNNVNDIANMNPIFKCSFVIFVVITIYHVLQLGNVIGGGGVRIKYTSSTPKSSSASFNDEIPTEFTTNKDGETKCEFQQPYEEAPVPLILIALGRSGSSVTWDTISTMLGSTTKAFEITGGNKTKAIGFFDNLYAQAQVEHKMKSKASSSSNSSWPSYKLPQTPTINNNTMIPTDWPIRKLCIIQKYNIEHLTNPGITGFQWKPYRVTLNHPLGQGGLYSISNHTNPKIKVIFLKRNPLDRLLSNLRHKGHQHTNEVLAHCAIDDVECLSSHSKHSKQIVLPIKKELVVSMRDGLKIDNMTQSYLDYFNVSYISLQYERLYGIGGDDDSSSDENEDIVRKEWMRIFDFLGRYPKKYMGNKTDYELNFSSEDVKEAFAIAPTSSKHHRDTIANYDAVEKTLKRHGLDYLLH